jgi:hypothetical protein
MVSAAQPDCFCGVMSPLLEYCYSWLLMDVGKQPSIKTVSLLPSKLLAIVLYLHSLPPLFCVPKLWEIQDVENSSRITVVLRCSWRDVNHRQWRRRRRPDCFCGTMWSCPLCLLARMLLLLGPDECDEVAID